MERYLETEIESMLNLIKTTRNSEYKDNAKYLDDTLLCLKDRLYQVLETLHD